MPTSELFSSLRQQFLLMSVPGQLRQGAAVRMALFAFQATCALDVPLQAKGITSCIEPSVARAPLLYMKALGNM